MMNIYRHLYKSACTPHGEQYKNYQYLQRAIRKTKALVCREQVPDTNWDDPPKPGRPPPNGTQQGCSRNAAGTQEGPPKTDRGPPKPTGDHHDAHTSNYKKHYRWKRNAAGTQGGFMIYDEMKLQGERTRILNEHWKIQRNLTKHTNMCNKNTQQQHAETLQVETERSRNARRIHDI